MSITWRISTNRVSGDTIQAVVRSKKRNGPHSELDGRRALANSLDQTRTWKIMPEKIAPVTPNPR